MLSSPNDRIRDVIVIGAGIAGLAAAEKLAGRDVLVLEASERPGGRMLSHPRGAIWLNSGAHMFGGPDSPVGRLAMACGLELRPIGGRLMGLIDGGRRLLNRRAESYPFVMALPPLARLSLMVMGLKLRRGSARSVAGQTAALRLAQKDQARALQAFENKRSLAQALGWLHPRIARFLEAITERNGAHPEDMAAGHGFRSFANVWSTHSPGNNLGGGSARLPLALADRLKARTGTELRFQTLVAEVSQTPEGHFRVQTAGGHDYHARAVIFALPAPGAAQIGAALPAPCLDALNAIRYGAFLTMAVHLAPGAAPWAGHYALATPGRSFSVLFDMGTTHTASEAQSGHSLMLFRGARGAAQLLQLSDEELRRGFLADLEAVFPETKGRVIETVIARWPLGAPYSFPGRAALQDALTDLPPLLALAGDYLDFPNMDAAIRSGEAAAAKILLDLS